LIKDVKINCWILHAMKNDQTPPNRIKDPTLSPLIWGIIILLSLPQIILAETNLQIPSGPLGYTWISWIRIILLATIWILSLYWPKLKPISGFTLAMLAFWVAKTFLEPFVFNREAWINWLENTSWGMWVVADRIQKRAIPVALMALTLIGSGVGRKELYLVKGDLKALASPARILQGNKTKPWNQIMRGWIPWYVLIITVILYFQVRPNLDQLSSALVFLPAALIAAIINAFAEEFIFRSMMLARLEPVVGSYAAIWMAAGLFGIMHYFGYPYGPMGVILAAYLGWIAAKSMVETQGIVWALVVHTIGDFVIYFFWAMS
jgi:membrane protease YdiL (CAAX protease family)